MLYQHISVTKHASYADFLTFEHNNIIIYMTRSLSIFLKKIRLISDDFVKNILITSSKFWKKYCLL